jgi:ABC-2 type transport system ATP-binding protein
MASGTPAELTSGAGVDETRFSAAEGIDVAALAGALHLGADGVVETRPGEYVVRAEGTPGLVADLAGWLRDHEVRLGELRAGRRPLEEVFLKLTSERT